MFVVCLLFWHFWVNLLKEIWVKIYWESWFKCFRETGESKARNSNEPARSSKPLRKPWGNQSRWRGEQIENPRRAKMRKSQKFYISGLDQVAWVEYLSGHFQFQLFRAFIKPQAQTHFSPSPYPRGKNYKLYKWHLKFQASGYFVPSITASFIQTST